jgi:rubrerythrin
VIARLIVALLAAGAVVYVLAALRAGAPQQEAPPDAPATELDARKRSALHALLDLEDERALGKLSEPDFEALAAAYEQEAIAALRELDRLRAARALPAADPDDLEEEIAATRARLECSRCGYARRPGEPCPRCGT